MTTWDEEMVLRIAAAVKTLREEHTPKLSVAKLSDRTAELGYPMSRTVIADLELGRRKKLDVAELVVLARALNVPPVTLIYPDMPGGMVEVWPGYEAPSIRAAQWFSGEAGGNKIFTDPDSRKDGERVERTRENVDLNSEFIAACGTKVLATDYWNLREAVRSTKKAFLIERLSEDVQPEERVQIAERIAELEDELESMRNDLRERGLPIDG
ncbi:hypothetical protein [Prescottella equi]|uniref:hypothetical protein n=1 Tax=Rhodococcus hoagii TaxID=43767 RepID=UPI00301E4807